MDKLNPFRANHRLVARASRARDPNTAKAEPARSAFSETKMVEKRVPSITSVAHFSR
jgi:hypothetical protein